MRDKILIVDGVENELNTLAEILQDEAKIITAADGEEALTLIEQNLNELEAVLLKLMIPKVDGTKVLETMNEKAWLEQVPVLIIDRPGSMVMENKCYDLGAADFIQKPFTPKYVKQRVTSTTQSFMKLEEVQAKLDQQTRLMRKQYQLMQKQTEDLHESKKKIIEALATVVEYRNMDNAEHVKNVEMITHILAEEMMNTFPESGLTGKQVELISTASALHDIGKITISDTILMKPGKMTDDEYEYMESHTTKGCEILEQIQGAWDEEYAQTCAEICRSHHERYDGSGYPDGLVGDEIPLSAQLVSVAEVYDALVNERVYKKAYTKEHAYNMILAGECGMFNPKIMECFRKTREKVEALIPDGLSEDKGSKDEE
jgi:putative two-component system response regulator